MRSIVFGVMTIIHFTNATSVRLMARSLRRSSCPLGLLAACALASAHGPASAASSTLAIKTLSRLPLRFEPVDGARSFVARSPGGELSVGAGEILLRSHQSVYRLAFLGADPNSECEATERLPGTSNYFIGNDPDAWRTGVPQAARVRCRGVYPGVDVVYYGSGAGHLEFDFVVAPLAKLSAIRLRAHGPARPALSPGGDIHFGESGTSDIAIRRPVVYQIGADGRRQLLPAAFRIRDREITFTVGRHDRRRELVVDPVVTFATYFGGDGGEQAELALDSSGNVFLMGGTSSSNFPLLNAIQTAVDNLWIAKIDPVGPTLLFSTYLGGSAADGPGGLAVDDRGDVYLTGSTASVDFPLKNAFRTTVGLPADAFVAKLSGDGQTLIYSTLLGGEQASALDAAGARDSGVTIAVDALGAAYVGGSTHCTDFPVVNAFQPTYGGAPGPTDTQNGFVAKVKPDGSGLEFSSFLGGSSSDTVNRLVVDAEGEAIVVGQTNSADFPTLNAFQAGLGGGRDGFAARVAADGSLLWSTFVGGSGLDSIRGVDLDGAARPLFCGDTQSVDLALVGPFQNSLPYDPSAMVGRIASDGSEMEFLSYLGGAGGYSYADKCSVGSDGRLWVVGTTASDQFPVVDAVQPIFSGINDVFVVAVTVSPPALAFATYLGGSERDYGDDVAQDANGAVWVLGHSFSTDLPTVCPWQSANAGDLDTVIVVLDGLGLLPQAPDLTICAGASAMLDGSSSSGCVGYRYRWLNGATELCGGWSPVPVCQVSPGATTAYRLEVECVERPGCIVGRTVTVSVVPEVVPGDLGNTLMAVRRGSDVVLQWGTSPAAVSYGLYRSASKGLWSAAADFGGLAGPQHVLPDVPAPPPLYFYRAVGVSCGGVEGP